MSMNGMKKSSTATIKATEEGILVPNKPVEAATGAAGAGEGEGGTGVAGWLVSINIFWHKVRETCHKSQP
jgi:hypothetical protein